MLPHISMHTQVLIEIGILAFVSMVFNYISNHQARHMLLQIKSLHTESDLSSLDNSIPVTSCLPVSDLHMRVDALEARLSALDHLHGAGK